jgi:hypothetical protein
MDLGGRARRALWLEGGLPLLWIALTLALLYPIWHQRLLPMLDTPNHLALVRGWHSYDDPSYDLARYYQVRVRVVPYLLYYGTIHLLMYAVPIEIAHKLFLSAYLVLFPLSVLALARALKRSPWLALGAFPLAFNQNWIYGFASYLMSATLMFFALAALLRWLADGRRSDAIWLGLLSLLCYLGHILPWFVLGCCAIVILVDGWRGWRRGLVAAAVLLPSLVLAVSNVVAEASDQTYIKHGSRFEGTFRDVPTAATELLGRVLEIVPGDFDAAILAVLAATIGGLAVWRGTGGPERERRWARLVLAVLVLCYLSLPYEIAKPMSWWYVSPRIPSMMAVVLLLLPDVEIAGWRRLLLVPLALAGLALPLRLASLYADFDARNAPFMTLLEQLPRGQPTLVVVKKMWRGARSEEKSGDPVTSAPVYWHFSSYPMALRGGYGPYVFDQGIPIRPRREARLTFPAWTDTDTFHPRHAPAFRYYIVRYPGDEVEHEPSLKRLRRIGDWALYQRIHDQSFEGGGAEE